MRTFCPSCEKETSCVYIAELYECKECGCDFESKQRQMQERLDAAIARAEAAEARAERLQAVIIGMFPMWINAMSYCEHGRQSELLAMRNYYNGRANPMTNDDISLMFSVIPEKNEGGEG